MNTALTLCHKLLEASTEEEVVSLLKAAGYWEDRSVWRAYGNISNNRGVVGNQQSSPVGALVEKIVNSIDAVLISECWRAGIDPVDPAAPSTMGEAVEQFFGVTAGKLGSLDPSQRTELAHHVHLVASGTKQQPCYMIIDDGEGQPPSRFPDTFLSLLRENKARIPFVQGKYNMGSTGVLQFAGRHSFQLIISRRQAHLRRTPEDEKWGFTLVRRLDPLPEQPYSTYVYLAPKGEVLSFESESLNLLPGSYPAALSEGMEAGTCVRIWNYKLPGALKTIATLDLRYALERFLQEPALPVRIHERRVGYRANYYDTTMSGLQAVLSDNRAKIEPGFDTGSPLEISGVGRVDLRVVVMKEEESGEKRYPSGLFFNVNGQLHGEQRSDYLARRTKLDYLADSLIVTVDCTGLPQRVREDLFLASRDRMRQIEEKTGIERAIDTYLQDHPGLRDLNARRRQERVTSATEAEAINVMQELVRSDPTLAALFGRGNKITIPSGDLPDPPPYEGKRFPTYFRLLKEPKDGLVKNCPKNSTCRVQFETDAVNDYFSRVGDPGHLESAGMATVTSIQLWQGRATVRYSLPEQANVGDRLTIRVAVSDVAKVDPLESSFVIQVTEPNVDESEPGPPRPPGGAAIGLPNVTEVHQAEWNKYGFTERSVVQLKQGEGETIDLFINMDNLYLRNEIGRRRKMDPTILRYWFKWGITLQVVGMLYEQSQSEANATESGAGFGSIEQACRGLAITLIPALIQLGRASKTAAA